MRINDGTEGQESVSFVVIGYNEAATLADCLSSVNGVAAALDDSEVIYVDGGSSDDSVAIARDAGIDHVITKAGKRRAAENRNLGLAVARGTFIQFVDGDMVLDAAWLPAALSYLAERPRVAALFGRLEERNTSAVYQALQIDWEYPEGAARFCGGAALFRGAVLRQLGGFPEDVAYGEEPYLCWRIRNEAGDEIHHLHHRMALHDLAYQGFSDYWRRNVRCGETYAEIANRCKNTADPLWRDEVRSTLRWAGFMGVLLLAIIVMPWWGSGLALAVALAILVRKALQHLPGRGVPVAVLYALHTYFAKVGIAFGLLRWRRRA